MLRSTPLAPVVFATASAADTLLAGSRSPRLRRLRLLSKPLLMPALSLSFLARTRGRGPEDRSALISGVLVAQGLSGVGDIALLSSSERGFLTGLGAFFGAHVAYVAAFASAKRLGSDPGSRAGVATAAGLFVTVAPLMSRAAGKSSPRLRVPVLAYAGALSTMYAASTQLPADTPISARRTVIAGTALFLASDTILATRKFLMTQPPPPWTDSAVMATYTAGQALIAHGVASVVSASQGSGTTRV